MKREEELYEKIWNTKIGNQEMEDFINSREFNALQYIDKGERILDVGCGEGELACLAKNNYKEIYGVDISEKALKKAEKLGMKVKR